jgi:hypothetical protein
MKRRAWWSLVFVALVVSSGCPGSGGYTVKGKLMRGGQPLSFADGAAASVSFIDVKDAEKVYPAVVDKDSATYEIEVPAGTYNVAIEYYDKQRNDQFGGKYSMGTTQLQKEVTESTDDLDIDVPPG